MNFGHRWILKGWYGGVGLLLLCLLVACQSQMGVRVTAVPPTPLPTATEVPATPNSSPVATLVAEGPWLLWENWEYENDDSDVASGYYLSNRDGSALVPVEEISPNETKFYFGDNPFPTTEILHGPYLVTVQRTTTDTSSSLWHQTTKLSLWEFPSVRLVAETPLLSEATQSLLAENEDQLLSFTLGNIVWSQDSRYLAFAAPRDDVTSDIYLLDTQNGTIRLVVEGPLEAFPIAFSPNNKWLIYGSAETLYIECDCPDTIWLYNLEDGSTRHLYDSGRFRESVLGWLDEEWVITVANAFEGNDSNPRKINLLTGEIVLLDDGSFGVGDYSPNGFLLINRTPIMHTPDGFDTTLFTSIDIRSGSKTEFHVPSDGSQLVWIGSPIGLFTTHDRVNRYLFDHTGTIHYTLPYGDFHGYPQLSPNRQWLLADTSEGWDIYSNDGTLLADLNLSGQPQWLPDNQLLVREEKGWCIYHSANEGQDWTPISLGGVFEAMDSVWQVNELP